MKRHQSDYIVVAYWAHRKLLKQRRRELQEIALMEKQREVPLHARFTKPVTEDDLSSGFGRL